MSASIYAVDGNTAVTAGEITPFDTITIAVTNGGDPLESTGPLILNNGETAAFVGGSGTGTLFYTYTPVDGDSIATLAASGGVVYDLVNPQYTQVSGTFIGVNVDTVPPGLTLTGTSADALQGGDTVAALSGAVITDPYGDGTLTGAAVTIGNYEAGDILAINGQTIGHLGAIDFTYAYGTLVLSGDDGLADYASALQDVTYQDSGTEPGIGAHPGRTLGWAVNEGSLAGSIVTTAITIDRPPVVAAGDTVTFTAGAAPVIVDPGLTVTDPDGAAISSATVAIAGFLAGDTLGVDVGGTDITATYDAADGVLSLTGADSAADYQKVLESVAFSSSQSDPTEGGNDPSRTIDVSVTDADGRTSSFATATVHIVVPPPTITAGDSVGYVADGPAVTIDPGLALTDPAGADIASATIVIAGGYLAGDTLAFTAQDGITGAFNGGTLVLTGDASAAGYQSVLDSVVFSSTAFDPTNGGTDDQRTISVAVTDANGKDAISVSTVDVTPGHTFDVSTQAELNQAIAYLDSTLASGSYSIDFTGNITEGTDGGDAILFNGSTLSAVEDLYAFNLAKDVSVTLDGGGNTLDGAGTNALFVYQGDVTVENLTIADATATGGSSERGGGGAGLGGGLFVAGPTQGAGGGDCHADQCRVCG